MGKLSLYAADGALLVPTEVRCAAAGRSVRAAAAGALAWWCGQVRPGWGPALRIAAQMPGNCSLCGAAIAVLSHHTAGALVLYPHWPPPCCTACCTARCTARCDTSCLLYCCRLQGAAGQAPAPCCHHCCSDVPLYCCTACCRELLGKHLHFEVLRGAAAIEEAEADEQLAPAAAAAAASGSSGSSSSSSSSSSSNTSNGRRRLKWVRQRPAVLLPWGTGKAHRCCC